MTTDATNDRGAPAPERWEQNQFLPRPVASVAHALAEVARHRGECVAVRTADTALTYSELSDRSRHVAGAILECQPGAAAPLALLFEGHRAHAFAGTLGALHTGRVVAPLDPGEPVDRLARIVAASGAALLVTDRDHLDLALGLVAPDAIVLVEDAIERRAAAAAVAIDPESAALVLFTSGSTGEPKGVVLSHANLVFSALASGAAHGLGTDDRISLVASFAFIAWHMRVYAVLVAGATVCTFDLKRQGLKKFPPWVAAERVTGVSFAPSVLRTLTESAEGPCMDTVTRVTLGGEQVYARDVQRARALFGPHTVFSNRLTCSEVTGLVIAGSDIAATDELADGPAPIGEIEPWFEANVVDADTGREVGEGEPGRLVVIGRSVALGYWNDRELSDECFFAASDGRRGLRTSDLVRRRPDGVIEHLGRLDARVKVRGAMVATSEVEQVLTSVDEVAEAAVVARPAPDGGTRLVAYVAPSDGAALSAWKLRRAVAAQVPTTMVPAAFVALESLPRTIRGKVDTAALPPPPTPEMRPYRAPWGSEAALAELFAEVLGVERVGLDDDFFDLGGDSLAVVELTAAIRERFSREVAAATVVEAPTVAELSRRIEERRRAGASLVIPLRSEGVGHPFFCVAGGGAPAAQLLALSDAMPDRRFYGIQARGLEEQAVPDYSVGRYAQRVIGEISAVQPTGPYLIGGHSFGTLVALEIALRLEAAGEGVALLVLLDTVAPRWDKPQIMLPVSRAQSSSRARRVARAAKVVAERERRRAFFLGSGIVPRHGLRRYDGFFGLSMLVGRRYRPARTFSGNALVVRSEEGDSSNNGTRRSLPDLGWSRWVTGAITVASTPGTHVSMILRPHVDALAAAIDEALPR